MIWKRVILSWMTLLALVFASAGASAAPDVSPKSHVGVSDLASLLCLGVSGLVSAGEHQRNRDVTTMDTSDVPHAARGVATRGVATISGHAAKQAAARGVTQSQIRVAIEKGVQYTDRLHGTVSHVLNKGFASGKTLVVARNPTTNVVTTVIRQRSAFKTGTKLADGSLRYVPIQ